MTSARWRPLPRWLAIIGMTAIALSVRLVVAQADQEPKPHTARFDLLGAWLDAAERHEPGLLDPPLSAAARWSLDDLIKLRVDVSVLFFLVERPSLQRVRFVPSDEMRRTMSPRSAGCLDWPAATRQRPWSFALPPAPCLIHCSSTTPISFSALS